jgi:hypothetical protein
MTQRTILTATKLAAIAALTLLMSCGAGRLYVNPEADMGFYNKVGVFPFSNLTSDRSASDVVTSSFTTELLMLEAVEVANPGDFNAAAGKIAGGEMTNALEDLTAEQAYLLGEETGVQGIFVGAVTSYSMVRSGQEEFPLVGVIVRFIDCQTGTVVWSYETTRKGGPKFPIFSFGETHTLGNMTTKVCSDVARAFGSIVR